MASNSIKSFFNSVKDRSVEQCVNLVGIAALGVWRMIAGDTIAKYFFVGVGTAIALLIVAVFAMPLFKRRVVGGVVGFMIVVGGLLGVSTLAPYIPALGQKELGINRKKFLADFLDRFGQFRNTVVAGDRELTGSEIRNRIVFMSDIPCGPNNPSIIEGKKFTDCVFIGPAFIIVESEATYATLSGIHFLSDGAKSVFIDAPTELIDGGIGIRSCSFYNCYFFHTAFMGPKALMDKARSSSKDLGSH